MASPVPRDATRSRIHGLLVDSDVPLAHATPVTGSGPADVVVRRSAEPWAGPLEGVEVAVMAEGPHRHLLVDRGAAGYALDVPGVLAGTIDRSGGQVLLHLHPDADPGIAQLVVSGLVLSLALVVRGQTLVHASAVETGGRALAVMGPSGSGKSTLAAVLCRAGARLLADDQLRIDLTDGARCWPSARHVRARQHGLGSLVAERSPAGGSSADGRSLIEPALSGSGSCRLDAIVVPAFDPAGQEVRLGRLDGLAAATAILAARAVPGRFSPAWEAAAFHRALDIATTVPVWRAVLPWGAEHFTVIARELLALVDPTRSSSGRTQ